MKLVSTYGNTARGIERIGSHIRLLVAASNSYEVRICCSSDAWKNDSHPSIARIGRLEVDIRTGSLRVLHFGSQLIHWVRADLGWIIWITEFRVVN